MSHSPECFMCMACAEGFHDHCFAEGCQCPCSEPDPWDMREEWEATQPKPDVEMET